jgi:glutaredoxin
VERPGIRVYWQPGCTSCLRVKELLGAAGVPFESINVRTHPDATAELARLGVRAVPVVARGDAYVLGQDLDEVARFVGIDARRDRLEPGVLVARLVALLDTVAHHAGQLPPEALGERLPGRERTHLDLPYHAAQVAVGLLDAALGRALTFEHFERRAPPDIGTAAEVAGFVRSASQAVAHWWASNQDRLPVVVDTYYGSRPLHEVLERSTWHVAQHARQLERLLQMRGIDPRPPLSPVLLAGLPLPREVWDPEVPLG